MTGSRKYFFQIWSEQENKSNGCPHCYVPGTKILGIGMDNWDCLFCLDWYLIVFSACNSDGSLATGWHGDCEWPDVARSQISNQFVHVDKDITFAETNTLLAASSHSHPSWLYSDVELELKYFSQLEEVLKQRDGRPSGRIVWRQIL